MTKKKKNSSSLNNKKQLNLYLKSYKGGGINDQPYYQIFQSLQQFLIEKQEENENDDKNDEDQSDINDDDDDDNVGKEPSNLPSPSSSSSSPQQMETTIPREATITTTTITTKTVERRKAKSPPAPPPPPSSLTATSSTMNTNNKNKRKDDEDHKEEEGPKNQSRGTQNNIQSVLYPGCHRHITPSLFFPYVTYIDLDPKVSQVYTDLTVQEYISKNKVYDDACKYEFYCYDVEQQELKNNNIRCFDLLLSFNAGTIAQYCTKYIKDGGFLLVNDSHSDARIIFTKYTNEWELIAYYDNENESSKSKFVTHNLSKCFQVVVPNNNNKKKSKRIKNNNNNNAPSTITTTSNDDDNHNSITTTTTKPLSIQQAEESVRVGTIRKRSFRLVFEPMFYLFRKK